MHKRMESLRVSNSKKKRIVRFEERKKDPSLRMNKKKLTKLSDYSAVKTKEYVKRRAQ